MLRPMKLSYYLSVMCERGIEPEALLSGTGIEYGHLSDPTYVVAVSQCVGVVANMIRLTGDQGIGLNVGSHAQLKDFGITGHVMLSSSTLRQAATHWIQFGNLIGMLIRLTLLEEGNEWTVIFSAVEPMGFIYNFCVEEMLVSGLKIGSILVGVPFVVKEVQLSYPAPLHAHLYDGYLSCPVRFNCTRTSITFREPGLDTPLPNNDEELNEVTLQHCSHVLRQIKADNLTISRLRALFLKYPRSIPNLMEASAILCISPRTLARRLAEEGASYQALVNQFRLDLATEYLKSKQLSLEVIGESLGYSDTNAFRRAFKSWTGQTIGSYCAGTGREE